MQRVGAAKGRVSSSKQPRLAVRRDQLLADAKPSEVAWEALRPIDADAERRGGCESWVYFLTEHNDSSIVKIGVAKNPVERRRSLQSGNWRTLKLAAVIYGDRVTEQRLHLGFQSDRIVGSEWFRNGALILVTAAEIAKRQIEAPDIVDMEEMEEIAVAVIDELGSTKRIREPDRLLRALST